MQHLCHRRADDIRPLLRQAALGEIAAGVFGIGEIDVGDDIDDSAVRLLWKALVLAAVARFQMEDRNVEALRTNHRQAGVRVAQNQDGVGPDFDHQLVRFRDDVAHRLAEILADGIHIHLWLSEFQVLEEDAVEVVVVVLARVRKNDVKILAAFCDDGRKTDDFGARAHDDEQLQPPIVNKGM